MQRLAELPLNRKNMFLGAINKEILFGRNCPSSLLRILAAENGLFVKIVRSITVLCSPVSVIYNRIKRKL